MPRLTHFLTLGALLTHLLLGCCWHHAHGDTPQVAAACHDDHPCGSHQQPDRRHHEQPRCQQATCVFVRPSYDRLTLTFPASWQAFLPSAPSLALPAERLPGPSLLPIAAPVGCLRLHLLNQILLI